MMTGFQTSPRMAQRARVGALGPMLGLVAVLAAGCAPRAPATGALEPRAASEKRPNILIIEVDHLGTELGAYGDRAAATPNIDALARQGVTFANAYAASGGEDAETAALLTGVHPSTIDVVQEWTGEARWSVAPPPEVKAYPELLRAAGYHTFHVGARRDPFGSPASLWVEDVQKPAPAWPSVNIRQPFLGVVDLSTLQDPTAAPKPRTLWDRLQFWRPDPDAERRVRSVADARRIAVPAYLPDTPGVRAALKGEYDRVHHVDDEVGAILKRLDRAGALKSTVVIFTAKTGPARPRAERTVYEAGVHVPLIVRWPDGRGRGSVRRDLVSGVDLAPSVLKTAGLQPFAWMQGRDRLVSTSDPAKFAFTVQNRVDGVYERVFAVRDGRWLYVLNLALQTPLASLERPGPLATALQAARAAGRLGPAQARLFSDERPEGELYDLKTDPEAQHDLAQASAHSGDVQRLSRALNAFAISAPDTTTASTQDLLDSFQPGGQTPTAMAPSAVVQAGRVTLNSISPGAAILWRAAGAGPWKLYTGPIDARAAAKIETRAVRYGFTPSAVTTVDLKP